MGRREISNNSDWTLSYVVEYRKIHDVTNYNKLYVLLPTNLWIGTCLSHFFRFSGL